MWRSKSKDIACYEEDFGYLDINGDGRLSFDEARQYDPYMEDKEINDLLRLAKKITTGLY